MKRAGERGSGLLLVVGATAAASVLALAALTASALAYEIAVLRHAGTQARMLADSALEEVVDGLSVGSIPAPVGAAVTVWNASLPPPPAGFPSLGGGCGARVTLRVVEASGVARTSRSRRLGGARLIDAAAEGWCGRGHHTTDTRVALVPGGGALRLY